MDLKLFEDLIALARTQSFVRAAELRHVTHPAFGRRIRALETWAGAPLVERNRTPVQLTAEGEVLLKTAERTVESVTQARTQLQQHGGAADTRVRLGTGRTLAHTLAADWLARLTYMPRSPIRGKAQIEILTGATQDLAVHLEQGKVDLLCCYEHRALSIPINGHRYRHLTLAHEKLVPVSIADAQGAPRFALGHTDRAAPLISYGQTLAMGRLLSDHFERNGAPISLTPFVRCDSADAIYEFVRKGLGVAWLPWSMVASDCRRKTMAVLGGRSDEVPFEVRLYRARARQSDMLEAIWTATESHR
ncbi:LysR family transcriptional regulator [Pigmentiphaga litoralis]|uniref:LysR family transcriptional regulator n=1 Tax=Pigmentiphaga litoralis TaxID=516702 RepID=UPI003B438FD8